MKRSHLRFLIVASLGVGIGASIVLGSTHTDAAAPGPPGSAGPPTGAAQAEAAELTALRREIAVLRGQVRAHSEQLSGAAGAPLPRADSRAAPDRRDPGTDPELRDEAERRRGEHMAGVAAAFRDEATDPRWAAATSSSVQAAIADIAELRQVASGVECRSHTCRVEITDDGAGRLATVLPLLALRLGPELPSMDAERTENDRGAATTVLYMSRRVDAAVPR